MMGIEDLDLEAIGEEAWSFLKDELGDALDALEEEHKEETKALMKDLAKFTAKAIVDPANAEAYAEEVAFIKSSIASRAWMVEMEISDRMKKAVLGVLTKIAGVVLAAL